MSFKTPTLKARNILNVPDVDEFCDDLARRTANRGGKKWFTTIYRRWLLLECASVKYVVNENVLHSFEFRSHQAMFGSKPTFIQFMQTNTYVDVETLPDWAQAHMAKGKPLFKFEPTTAFIDSARQIADYFDSIEETPLISSSHHVIMREVRLWDRKVRKAKLLASLSDGVELDTRYVHDEFYVVRLVKPSAFQTEGAVMSHCVGNYYLHSDRMVYSIRHVDQQIPCATIEVYLGTLGMYLGMVETRFRGTPSEDVRTQVLAWAKLAGIMTSEEYGELQEARRRANPTAYEAPVLGTPYQQNLMRQMGTRTEVDMDPGPIEVRIAAGAGGHFRTPTENEAARREYPSIFTLTRREIERQLLEEPTASEVVRRTQAMQGEPGVPGVPGAAETPGQSANGRPPSFFELFLGRRRPRSRGGPTSWGN